MNKKDKQFYRMIIRECEYILPLVNGHIGLCTLLLKYHKDSWLKDIITMVTNTNSYSDLNYFTIKHKGKNFMDCDYNPKEWKSDRIFLLKEIIRYCKYKLNGK